MKKAVIVAMVLGLVAGALSVPAVAKSKAKPKPVTLYMHGDGQTGEQEIPDNNGTTNWKDLTTAEPAAGPPKSMFVTNYVVGPNNNCSGNNLYPTWGGPLIGSVSGDLKIILHTVATPAANLKVDVFPDGAGGCTNSTLGVDDYVEPVATQTVTLAPGPAETEVVFENVKFKTFASLVVMLTLADQGTTPAQARVLYDSPEYPSRVELLCAPKSGKSCAP